MIMHLGGMVERIVRQDCLTVPEDQRSDYNLERFQQVKEIAKIVEEALLIKIPPEELYYLVQILNNTLETEVK